MAETAAAKDAAPKESSFLRLLRTNPPAGAATLLGLFLLPPLAVLLIALPDGWSGWCTASVALMVAAIAPPALLLVRLWRPAGAKGPDSERRDRLTAAWLVPGQYLCWAELVQVALRIVSTGFKPVHALPAGVAVMTLMTLTSAQPAPAALKDRTPESMGLWVKENIEAIVVAFIMALVIRCFCIEVFKIPSSSMEPTLLGDNTEDHRRSGCPFKYEHRWSDGGDRIMVTKYYYSFSSIERYDVVVFKFPLNQSKNFIKRVVGLPEEKLKIFHGNIFTKKKGESEFRIARRTLRTQDSIWIPADGDADYLSSGETFQNYWKVAGEGPRAEPQVQDRELTTLEKAGARAIRFEHKGDIDDGHGQPVGEVQLAFDFEITSPHGVVTAEVSNEYGKFEAWLSTDAMSELRVELPDGKDRIPLKDVRLAVDRRYRLALSVYDGAAIVRLNDEQVGQKEFITALDSHVKSSLIDNPKRVVAFGASDLTMKVKNLSLGRDVYYKGKEHIAEDSEIEIPEHCYVMMGDNVDSSHDARSWTRKSITLTDGRKLFYEQQDSRASDSTKCQEVQKRYGLPREPDFVLKADEYGNEYALYNKGTLDPKELPPGGLWGVVEKEDQVGESYYKVDEKFIVGKALWIWWPKGRWFHLIR